jgi:hypothetical protein
MPVAHYRINELDAADRIVDGYSVMCRSDAAALAMAEVWENTRHVARLEMAAVVSWDGASRSVPS